MRVLLVAATVLPVVAASALNLALGAAWVTVLLALLALRRRVRWVDWATLAVTVAVAAAGLRLGWLTPPPAPSYARDEVTVASTRVPRVGRLADWWTTRSDGTAATGLLLRARLRERRFQETQYAAGDLERRAAAAVAAGRQAAAALAAGAPAEAAALEEAVRRLATTLTAPEFRDLQSRRARLEAWFTELEARLAESRDETDLGVVAQGLEPAAIASVSFRALREDLARVNGATAALVRAVSGADVRVSVVSRLEYDEAAEQVTVEDVYVFRAAPPLRMVRVDVGALRQATIGQRVQQTLTYATAPAASGQPVGPPEIVLSEPARTLIVVDRRAGPPPLERIRSLLRPVPFWRLALPATPGAREFGVAVTLPAGDALLGVEAPARRLDGIRLAPHAFHWASAPGRLEREETDETWRPDEPERAGAAPLAIELVPRTMWLRNAAFARLRGYLYAPNPTTGLALVGLAAAALVLTRRRRAPRLAGA